MTLRAKPFSECISREQEQGGDQNSFHSCSKFFLSFRRLTNPWLRHWQPNRLICRFAKLNPNKIGQCLMSMPKDTQCIFGDGSNNKTHVESHPHLLASEWMQISLNETSSWCIVDSSSYQALSSFRRERAVELRLGTLALPFLLLLSYHTDWGTRCLHLVWKGNNIKVVDDCNILNNQIPVSVAKLTERSKYIKALSAGWI